MNRSFLIAILCLITPGAMTAHEIEGQYCFLMKNNKTNPSYCLLIGETSIEMNNGPVRYYAENLRITCANDVCTISDRKDKKLAVVKRTTKNGFIVTASFKVHVDKSQIGMHELERIVEKGDKFRQIE